MAGPSTVGVSPIRLWLIAVPMVIGLSFLMASSEMQERIGSIFDVQANQDRVEMLRFGKQTVAAHPWLGLGPNQVPEAWRQAHPGERIQPHLHDNFVQIAAETGLLGVACWTLMLLSCLRELRRQRRLLAPWRDDPEARQQLAMTTTVRNSLLAYLLGGFFLSAGYLPFLYLLVAYTIALAEAADRLADELRFEQEARVINTE